MVLCDIRKVHETSDKIDLGPSKYTRSKTFFGSSAYMFFNKNTKCSVRLNKLIFAHNLRLK